MARPSSLYHTVNNATQLLSPGPEPPAPDGVKLPFLDVAESSGSGCSESEYEPTQTPASGRVSIAHLSTSGSGSETDLDSTPTRTRHTTPAHGLKSSARRWRDTTPRPTSQRAPLVLLHVTLLPLFPAIRAGTGAADALSQDTRSRLSRLEGKLAGELSRRGVLIKHPRSDFALLEERILQALELEQGRVSADGHFLGRDKERHGPLARVDSGTGPGVVSDEDRQQCGTCCGRIEEVGSGVRAARRWEVQVFAGNGRMGAQTWAVAWEEMEAVDVLVTPWLSELEKERVQRPVKVGALADERQGAAAAAAQQEKRTEEEEEMLQRRIRDEEQLRRDQHEEAVTEKLAALASELRDVRNDRRRRETVSAYRLDERSEALPPAFMPDQVPIDVLLRNYLVVLAKDARNILILAMLVVIIMLSIQLTASRSAGQLERFDSCRTMGEVIAESLAKSRHHQASIVADSTDRPVSENIEGSRAQHVVSTAISSISAGASKVASVHELDQSVEAMLDMADQVAPTEDWAVNTARGDNIFSLHDIVV